MSSIQGLAVLYLLTGIVPLGACASGGVAECPPCPAPATACSPEVRAAVAPIERPAPAADRSRELALMGFSEDGDRFALRVKDALMGRSFQIYDRRTHEVTKTYIYTPDTERRTWREVRRRHRIVALTSASQRQPGGDLVILGADSGPWVVLYVLRGERAVPYLRIERLRGEDGALSTVSFERIAWEPHGRYVVVIHRQVIARPRRMSSDHLTVFEVDLGRLPFDVAQ